MNISQKINGTTATLQVEGRLDTQTAPILEKECNDIISDITELIFDFINLEYVSSAGLRVILGAQKKMNLKGKLIIKNVNDTIMEVFEITGFSDILTIE